MEHDSDHRAHGEDPARSEARDGMRIDRQVPIRMDDGAVLRADVYRPDGEGRHPVVLSHGPYAKGSPFQDAYPVQWDAMVTEFPEITRDSSGRYQAWEVVDPERWVPDGYAVVRVDSRGSGWSPGFLDVLSPRETRDLYDCVEWAAAQPWSTGRVGLCGISYYAINAWLVAGLQPPHLTAMIPWEGVADFYRDAGYHGGIPSEFSRFWYPGEVLPVQYGNGERSFTDPNTGDSAAGPVTLTEEELAAARTDVIAEMQRRPLDDTWYRERSADWSKITVPFLSAANWGGQGLHSRGNFEGFTQAASEQKWLEVHGLEHWTMFYNDYGLSLQKRFFGHFLKGEDTGWEAEPRVRMQVRHADGIVTERFENEWPLARTKWTPFHLDTRGSGLVEGGAKVAERAEEDGPASGEHGVSYEATGGDVTFWTPPLDREVEITGPIAAKLFVSSSTSDADLFTIVRVFRPDGSEVVFRGALDANTPIGQGWLRASHRELDEERSLPHRPYHRHRRVLPLNPGEVYELDIEIWPTCVVVPPGHRIALTVRSTDYEYGGEPHPLNERLPYPTDGCGPCTHVNNTETGSALVTVHSGGRYDSHLLLPVIPRSESG
ncbi:CocE/NonD family hydrolase [Actinomadura fulvescens]|uniref:CocE/NonD family hydrolase n=1 Tax=Actinomadura fulvescens TaxID=46160 RepID=A0ABN3QYA4_9ACTN